MKALWFIDTPMLTTHGNAVNSHFVNFRKRISQNPYQACFHLGAKKSPVTESSVTGEGLGNGGGGRCLRRWGAAPLFDQSVKVIVVELVGLDDQLHVIDQSVYLVGGPGRLKDV